MKTSRNLEAMTWGDFRELFIRKFLPASARYAKAHEFLELRQGSMTVLEYVSKFTELARFGDDDVTIDLAKVRRFENGIKFSIQEKIMGLRLQDMDSMVRTALTIKRELEDAQSIRAAGTSRKREDQPSSSFNKKQKTSVLHGSQGQDQPFQDGRHFWTPS